MTTNEHDQHIIDALQKQIQEQSIMLYLKGTPESPQCGFSAKTAEILIAHHVPFAFVDILAFPDTRRLLPSISQWPTFPQLFVQGELIGGADIVQTLQEQGKLEALLQKASA